MRVLIQRVTEACVRIENAVKDKIGSGLLVFAGIENEDTLADIQWLSNKIVHLRVFNDSEGVMNLNVKEIKGDILLISQFTLHAATKKGNRPSYSKAAAPGIALPLYEQMISRLEDDLGKKIATGVFGADMQVSLVNDGPVTIWIDSKNKE